MFTDFLGMQKHYMENRKHQHRALNNKTWTFYLLKSTDMKEGAGAKGQGSVGSNKNW